MSNEKKHTLKRIIKSGVLNFKRHPMVSVSSIIVMTITLLIIVLMIFSQATLQAVLSNLEKRVDVKVYFVLGASEKNILTLKDTMEKLPEISSIKYISETEALFNFREKHKDDALTIQALDEIGTNPLNASFNIKAKEASQYESIVKSFENQSSISNGLKPIIEKINYDRNKTVIEKLSNIIKDSKTYGFFITLISCIVAIVVTFNTIRLTIYFTKDEISVMRLVGASKMYVRGPFVVEGLLYGIFSTLITIIIVIPITLWAGEYLTNFLGINMFSYFVKNSIQIIFILFVVGTLLGGVSSYLAIRKYLKI